MVAIVGAGISGLMTALALHQADIPAEVYEQRKTVGGDAGGQAILQISRTMGLPALTQLGLDHDISSTGFPVHQVQLRDEHNQILTTFDAGKEGNVGTTRAALYQILHAAVAARGIPVYYRRALQHIHAADETITLEFRDGTSTTTDLLVGAEGPRSIVRAAIASHAGPKYGGQWYVHGLTHHATVASEPGTFVVIRNNTTHHALGYTTLTNGPTRWWLRVTAPPRHHMIDPANANERAELHALAPNDTAADMINAATIDMSSYNADCVSPLHPWTNNTTIALVGDAIHACSPSAGQNVALAAEDASTLARALRDAPNIPAALTRYQHMRQHRAHRAITAADPSNNLDSGPNYPLEWHTAITDALAQQTRDQYRVPATRT